MLEVPTGPETVLMSCSSSVHYHRQSPGSPEWWKTAYGMKSGGTANISLLVHTHADLLVSSRFIQLKLKADCVCLYKSYM